MHEPTHDAAHRRDLHRAARRLLLAATAGLGLAAAAGSAAEAAALQSYNVDPNSVSVSGLSSGGYMAAQLGIAYSNVFKVGFGVFAGGPYDCARNQGYTSCMYNATPSITQPNANINAWSGNQIDAKANLTSRKMFMWVGTSDFTVGPNPMNQLKAQLNSFGSAANIKFVSQSGSAHVMPTDFDATGNNSCGSSSSPYIANCGYDGAGEVLKWMYGTLNARNNGTLSGSIVAFDQNTYLPSDKAGYASGYLYVPAACSGGAEVCKLHVALHGCQQGYGTIGDKFVRNTGYNRWADTNKMIILYPQAKPDNTQRSTWASGSLPNPNGCWDWVGWYGANADQKGGVHMAGIVGMVNKITSGHTGGSSGGGGGGGTTIPGVPSGLTVTGKTTGSVSLSWSASGGAASYKVYRGTANVGTTSGTTYTDTGLTANTTYAYSVSAVNAAGESAKSSSVGVTTDAQQGYSETASATVTMHYVAGRISVTNYNILGVRYGYNATITLYKCGTAWTDKSNCGPI